MKIIALLATVVGVVYSQVNVPARALKVVRDAGLQTLSDTVKVDNERLIRAVKAFKPINATCNNLQGNAITKCGSCMESKCIARAESVCKPAQWQVVLGKITSGVIDVGKKIGSGVGKAVEGIKKVGSKIGKAIGSIFGKREMVAREAFIRSRRRGEPGCSELKNNPDNVCRFYLNPNYCSDCGFNADAKCPGYKAARGQIQAANNQRKWMTGIRTQNYDITMMSFNPALFGNGGFNNVVVSVNLFGKDLRFTVRQPINPYIPNVAGPIIARQALDEFKK